ncbi:MAG: hypothetical protein JW757_09405 [Anaerolineales bacterium]|nr:hypothetical protein [Anaerolineales bacterium]
MTRAKSCLVLFILSVIAGAIAGFYLVEIMEPPVPTVTPAPSFPVPTSSTDPDRTVLVVGVDNLEYPNPAIEGVWIVSLLDNADGMLHLKLITLYPVVEASVTSTRQIPYTHPHPKIRIDPDDLHAVGDLAPISFSYDRWSQIIVLDEIAINTIIMMQNLNFRPPAPTPVQGAFLEPWIDPEGTFQQHKRILTILCENPTPLSDPANINILTAMEGTHIRSTLPAGGLRSLWQVINYLPGKQVTCSQSPSP